MAKAPASLPAVEAQRSAAKILWYFALFLDAAAALALIALIFLGLGELRLAIAGADAAAEVIDLRENSYSVAHSYSGSGRTVLRHELRTDYFATLTFTASDGQTYTQEHPVSEDLYRSLSSGETLTVRYVVNTPTLVRVEPQRSFWALVVPAVLAAFFAASGGLFHRMERKIRLKLGTEDIATS